MSGLGWILRSLGRHRLRAGLSIAGVAISAALLLDMVMLSGGIERSFAHALDNLRDVQVVEQTVTGQKQRIPGCKCQGRADLDSHYRI